MIDTRYSWDSDMDGSRFAAWHDAKGEKYKRSYKTRASAADDLLTTIEDFCKFGIFVINGAGLSPSIFNEMIKPQSDIKKYTNVKSMIAVQPLTYDYFVKAMGIPGILINSGNKYNKDKRNVNLTGDSFLPYAKNISIPTMMIQNSNDPMTNLDMVNQYYNDLPVEKELLMLDLEKKRGAAYDWIGKNPDKILEFFGKHLN